MTRARHPALAVRLAHLRSALGYALGFSIFVNLMLLGPTLFMLQVFDRVLTSRSDATLVMLGVGVAIALLAMGVVDALRSHVLVDIGRRLDEALAQTVLQFVVRQASSPENRGPSGGLRDVGTLRAFLSGPNILALFDAPWMVIYGFVIFLFHPLMGLVALCGAILLVALSWASERTNRVPLEQQALASRHGSQFIDQGLRNADVLNGMGMTGAFAARWDAMNRRTLELMQRSGNRGGSLLAASKFLRQAVQVAMMGLGAWLILHDQATPGVMLAGTILFGRAMAPVEAIIGNWGGLVAARGAWQRLSTLLPETAPDTERTPLPAPSGHLQLERVTLAGARADAPILRGVDFELPAGKSLGILGPSGAGKSSLAKIVLGIWQPSGGKVRIDGAEFGQWDPAQLGPYLGYLPQDVELFPGTVAQNIARFEAEAGEDVVEAARRAHAYEIILKLPLGFDTQLGEGGIRLSAGQAQRVGLARALFRRPKVVVLDEPNSNLDAEGEQALRQALEEMRQDDTTVLMITHKPSLVAALDYLMVMRDGRVEMMGPRDEVMAKLSAAAAPGAQERTRRAVA